METKAKLERLERIVDASGIAPRIEALLPVGVRPRQLSVRTLLIGMLSVAVRGAPRAPEPGARGARSRCPRQIGGGSG